MKRRKLTKEERKLVYDKCNGHCAYCGEKLELSKMQVDHIEPFIHGGSDTLDNMLPACRSCNHYKSCSNLETFREMLENQPKVLLRDCVTYKIATRFRTVKPNEHKIVFYFEKLLENNKEKEQLLC